jgi:hypothetical protein
MGVDLSYYWMHRTAHEYHILWIGHSVHHSGEYYNLATALRQGIIQSFYGKLFHLPLALLGFPCGAWLAHSQLNTLYQFWIHTEQITKLSFLEMIFNTPSHHRMHHRPPGNCNYGGLLILWDRLFHTFREEKEMRDYYGLAQQLKSNNPLYANFAHVHRMFNISSLEEGEGSMSGVGSGWYHLCRHLIGVVFKRRVIHPHVITLSHFTHLLPHPLSETTYGRRPPSDRIRYGSLEEDQLSTSTLAYVLVTFLFTMLYGVRLLLTSKSIPFHSLLAQVSICIFSLVCIGLLTEKKKKNISSRICESIRVFLCCSLLLIHSAFPILISCHYDDHDPHLRETLNITQTLIAPWNKTMRELCVYQQGLDLEPYFMIPVTLSGEMCFVVAWIMVMAWGYIHHTEYLTPRQKQSLRVKEL